MDGEGLLEEGNVGPSSSAEGGSNEGVDRSKAFRSASSSLSCCGGGSSVGGVSLGRTCRGRRGSCCKERGARAFQGGSDNPLRVVFVVDNSFSSHSSSSSPDWTDSERVRSGRVELEDDWCPVCRSTPRQTSFGSPLGTFSSSCSSSVATSTVVLEGPALRESSETSSSSSEVSLLTVVVEVRREPRPKLEPVSLLDHEDSSELDELDE